MTPTAARVIYPELPDPLTPGDLQQLFSPSFDERNWAPTVTRTVESQVALLVQLKIFQSTGRFRRAADVPHATARGWADGADGLVRAVKRALDQKASFLDAAVGSGQQAYLRRGKHGRPVVTRLRAVLTPETAIDLENQMMAHMPERALLEAISNTEHWAQWGRHFGLPSRLGPQIFESRWGKTGELDIEPSGGVTARFGLFLA